MRTLPVHLVHKVWGRQMPPAPFANPGEEPLGEIWFDPPPELDSLLVKFIFTDAALSVQVHPDDAQARRASGARTSAGTSSMRNPARPSRSGWSGR